MTDLTRFKVSNPNRQLCKKHKNCPFTENTIYKVLSSDITVVHHCLPKRKLSLMIQNKIDILQSQHKSHCSSNPKNMCSLLAFLFQLMNVNENTENKAQQTTGQLTKSPGCGDHQSISFPGSQFYCYGDACSGTVRAQVRENFENIFPILKSHKSQFSLFSGRHNFIQVAWLHNGGNIPAPQPFFA